MFSLFGNKSNNNTSSFPWIELNSEKKLEDFLLKEDRVLVFKHSTRCYTSKKVLAEFERTFADSSFKNFVFVYVIEQRPLSNYLASFSGVVHESPQALLFTNGKVEGHASHFSIIEKDWDLE
jgi:bacillithiol system protein YtxJ